MAYEGTPPNNEAPAITCGVYMDGVLQPFISVVSIEDNFGILPSKCLIQFGNNGQDFVGPVTLNSSSWDFGLGSRVEVMASDGVTLFLGSLQKRHDQGQTNKILWTALSDLELVGRIPLRGALVYNDTDGDVKLCTAYEQVMNPGGFWNCVGALSVLDGETIVPVYLSHAELGLTYQSPDLTVPVELQEGVQVPWTPRLGLLHLQYLSQLSTGAAVQGIDSDFRGLASCDRLTWDASSITSLVGYDVPTTSDPLDRKLPETDLRGVRMLGAIDTLLQAAGTHDVQVNYFDGVSYLNFQPVSFSAFSSTGGSTPAVNLLRGGPANTTDTLYDFDLADDATQVAEQVIVDGQRIHVEFSITNYSFATENSVLAWNNAWTNQQEAAFLVGINGGYNQSIRPFPFYAVYPSTQGTIGTLPASNTSLGTWLLADGQAGRAYAEAKSQAAADLLWKSFPFVYRAFTIDSDALATSGVMAGYLSQYSDQSKYPVLSYARPCLPRQMQFYLNNPSGGDAIGNWLKDAYPVRIRLLSNESGDGNYHEVPEATRIRVSPQGMIFLDGLQFEVNGKLECLYDGDLTIEPLGGNVDSAGNLSTSRLKNMILNLVVPMDHRVSASASIDPTQSIFTPEYNAQLGGPTLMYVYSPGSYAETSQVNSQPGAETHFHDGSGTATTPLNRFLPPGSERNYAAFAAQRKLYASRYPDRNGVFRLFGIRTDFKAGMWIGRIIMVNGADPLSSDYDINAPIRSILWDFQPGAQNTTLGGVHNASSAYGGERASMGAMR